MVLAFSTLLVSVLVYANLGSYDEIRITDSEIGSGFSNDDSSQELGTEPEGHKQSSESVEGSIGETSEKSDSDVASLRVPIVNPATTVHQIESDYYSDKEYQFDGVNDREVRDASVRDFSAYTPPTNTNLKKTVLGFAPYWVIDSYSQYFQMDKLSVLAYFSVACFPDGSLVKVCVGGQSSCGDKSGWEGWNSQIMRNIISEAHANGTKVVMTIKNFDKPSIEQLIANPAAIDRLADNIIYEMEAKNTDGVNIDFEYIGTASSTNRLRFAGFVDEIADRVHAARPGSHVSVDILATSGINPLLYDVNALGKTSVDHIMVMSYDFHSTSYFSGKMAGPESPLYGAQYWYNVSRSMNDIAALTRGYKILMGVPYYGLEFPVSGSTWPYKNATVIADGAISTYGNVVDSKYDAWHNSSTIQWDSGEKLTWYRYRWPDPSGGPEYWQGYYDDPNSLGAKYDFVNAKNLGGIGIWALGYDRSRTELWRTIRDKFSMEPFIVTFNEGVSSSRQNQIHSSLGGIVQRSIGERSFLVKPQNKTSEDLIEDYRGISEVAEADFGIYHSMN